MKAAQFSQFGGPEVLEIVDLPEPHAGDDQIRIAVRAAGVNPIDWKVRGGAMGGDLPRRVGQEVAGVIDEVGDGVTDAAVGDPVYGFPADGGGAAAAFVVSAAYAPIPDSMDFIAAAALPVAVETAWRCLDLLGVGDGQTLLINGAAGAVGLSAIQLARLRGVTVIGTASERNHEQLRTLGAVPTTYGPGLPERVAPLAPHGVDRALDAGSGALPEIVEIVGDPQHVVAIADYMGAEQTGVPFTGGPGTERAVRALTEIGPLIAAGEFSLPVAETFALEQIADAQRLGESGHAPGKLVLVVSD